MQIESFTLRNYENNVAIDMMIKVREDSLYIVVRAAMMHTMDVHTHSLGLVN